MESSASRSKLGRARKISTMPLDWQMSCKMESLSLKHMNGFAPLFKRTSMIGTIFGRNLRMLNLFRAARWIG